MYLCKTFVQQLGVLILLVVESWRYPKNQRLQSLYQLWFFKLCANFAIHHSVCVVNILLHKGSKSRKNSLGVKNRYSTMLSISTSSGRDFYLQKPLAQMLLLLLLFWWLLFVSFWLGFLRYLWWFHTQSSSMYSTASSPLLNITWTSKKRNFSKLKSRIPKEF